MLYTVKQPLAIIIKTCDNKPFNNKNIRNTPMNIKNTNKNRIKAHFFAFVIMLTIFCCVLSVLPKTVRADEISGKKLQYFKLENPVAVCRSGDEVYIAQKGLIIVYYNDTYRTLDLNETYKAETGVEKQFDITSMSKCENTLLFMSGNQLYCVNLDSFKLRAAPLLENITAFSVCEDRFIASLNDNAKSVKFFKYNTATESLFEEFTPTNVYTTINGNNPPVALCYTNTVADNTTFYFSSESLSKVENRTITSVSEMAPTAIAYSQGVLYMRVNNIIYSLNAAAGSNEKKTVLDLTQKNLTNAKGFFTDNGKMLLCDTENDRVIEFDLTGETAKETGFEISFTKINLPENFAIQPNAAPQYITVNDNDQLYNVVIDSSVKEGYFVFGGMFQMTSGSSSQYLVAETIKDGANEYYLIVGKCTALVLASDYSPIKIDLMRPQNEELVFTSDSKVYKLPYTTAEKSLAQNYDNESDSPYFVAFSATKGTKTKVLKECTLRGIKFAYVQCEQGVGYIPLSCLTKELLPPETRKDFTTATTARKVTNVYSDKELKNKIDELSSYSEVLIYSEENGVYYISYGEGKFGYLAKTDIVKKGDYVKRAVIVAVLLSLSLCLTFIFFENKYLYRDKK